MTTQDCLGRRRNARETRVPTVSPRWDGDKSQHLESFLQDPKGISLPLLIFSNGEWGAPAQVSPACRQLSPPITQSKAERKPAQRKSLLTGASTYCNAAKYHREATLTPKWSSLSQMQEK